MVDLVGGVGNVTLGDAAAVQRGGTKTVRERLREPTFPLVVEMRGHSRWITHLAATSVDALLSGEDPTVQARVKLPGRGNFVARECLYDESDDLFTGLE